MVTVYRAHGLRFIIFVDDCVPAHVHVVGDGHTKINLAKINLAKINLAKINLVGADGAPEIVTIEGMKRGDVRHAMQTVTLPTAISAVTMEREPWLI